MPLVNLARLKFLALIQRGLKEISFKNTYQVLVELARHYKYKLKYQKEYKLMYDNIVLIGFMGCGKTSVGKILARQLHKKFKDIDNIIEKEQECSITEIFQSKGEEYFRALEQKCINELTENSGLVISTGGGLPIYSTIPEKSLIIYIETGFHVILNRLPQEERDKRPLFHDEAKALALFNERTDIYKEQAIFSVDADQSIQLITHVLVDYILDQRVK